MIILSKEKVKRHFFCNTLYLAHRRLGRGHLVLRHSVPHFPLNSAHFLCWGAKLKAAVLTRHQSEKSSSSIDRLIDHSAIFNTLGKSQKICKFKSFICKNILKTYKAITLRRQSFITTVTTWTSLYWTQRSWTCDRLLRNTNVFVSNSTSYWQGCSESRFILLNINILIFYLWICPFYRNEEVKYLFTYIFSFLRSGVEAKLGVEFRHSARNASRIRRKVGNGVS